MFEFILGSIFGAFLLLPIILVALAVKFPFKMQHGLKKSTQPAIPPPKSHTSPYLYRLFSDVGNGASGGDSATTSPALSHDPNALLASIRNDILLKLSTTNTADTSTPGETLNWLNLFIVTIFDITKQIFTHTDNQILATCAANGLPITGTNDTTNLITSTTSPMIDSSTSIVDQVGLDEVVGTEMTIPPTPLPTTTTTAPTPSSPLPQPIYGAGSSTIMPIINRILTKAIETVPFLGPTRITYLDFRTILPQINHIKIITLDIPTNTLVFDIGLSFTTDSTVEIDLSAEVQYQNLLIASMPLQAALANVHTSLNLRIAIDPGDIALVGVEDKGKSVDDEDDVVVGDDDVDNNIPSTAVVPPSISFSLLEPPILRFDLATSFGYSYWLTNSALLHTLVHKAAQIGAASIVAPNFQSVTLPNDIYTNVIKSLAELATK